jgi:SAM-dependent methyltransferase
MIRALGFLLSQFGFDPRVVRRSLRGLGPYLRDLRTYRNMMEAGSEGLPITRIRPYLADRFDAAGYGGHYFFQDIWAARKIHQRGPHRHVDIGSSIGGFVSHLLAFRSVEVLDMRPWPSPIDGLTITVGDATSLEVFADDSLESISSLHAAEHFGLGRYGDPIDPAGHLKFMRSLTRVLAPGGFLYFSVPIGVERVDFNGQRVLTTASVLSAFDRLSLHSFSCVRDDGRFERDCDPRLATSDGNACGLFEFTKR